MHYSLRITPQYLPQDVSASTIFSKLIKTYDISYSALCYEVLDKYGEATKPHFHFNFIAGKATCKANIQHYIKQFGIKGPAMYALSDPSSVNDERWWRYTMKENLLEANLPPSLPSIALLTFAAISERRTTIALNLVRRAAINKKATLFEKMELKMNETHDTSSISTNFFRGEIVFRFIVQYYMDENRSINVNTIKGYTNLHLLKTGALPLSDFVQTYWN